MVEFISSWHLQLEVDCFFSEVLHVLPVLIEHQVGPLLTALVQVPDGKLELFAIESAYGHIFPSVDFVDHGLVLDGQILKMVPFGKISLTFLNLRNEFIIDLYHLEDEVFVILYPLVEHLGDVLQLDRIAGVVVVLAVLAAVAKKG